MLAVLRRIARRNAVLAQMIAGRPMSEPPRSRLFDLRSPLALRHVLAATALLLHLRVFRPPPDSGWTWQPLTVAGSTLEWRLDAWNWIVSALHHRADRRRSAAGRGGHGARGPLPRLDLSAQNLERTLWLAAAALVFVASAQSPHAGQQLARSWTPRWPCGCALAGGATDSLWRRRLGLPRASAGFSCSDATRHCSERTASARR